MSRLIARVILDGVFVGPGEVPPEVAALITNPAAWEGGQVPAMQSAPDSPAPEVPEPDGPGAPPMDPPPKAGRGSSVEAWAAYAAANGVEVPADAKRDDIVAALAAAGVKVED